MSEQNKIDDGGPAFPLNSVAFDKDPLENSDAISYVLHHPGMSLRDWFAGMAIIGLAAGDERSSSFKKETWAKNAYTLADAMISERKKGAS